MQKTPVESLPLQPPTTVSHPKTLTPLSAPMASRCRSFSKPAFSLLKSAVNKPAFKATPMSSLPTACPSINLSRPIPQLGCLQSLLPFHTAVSSARLTSCLGIDSRSSRSLSQGMLGANPGV